MTFTKVNLIFVFSWIYFYRIEIVAQPSFQKNVTTEQNNTIANPQITWFVEPRGETSNKAVGGNGTKNVDLTLH